MKLKLFRCAVAAAALAATALAQAQDSGAPPLPGPPRPLNIATPTEQGLPNGLRVVVAERPGVQLISAELLVLSGSEADPPGKAGLAAMTAALLTKGTRRHSATQLALAAESLGGSLDSAAGWQQSGVGMTVAVPKIDAALDLISEVVQAPSFAQDELARLRARELDNLKVAYSRPGTLASLSTQRLLFGQGAYGHPSGGTPASLQRIGRADLLAMHAAQFRPAKAVLVLSGDLDAATGLRLAQRHFGAWKSGPETHGTDAPAPNAELAQQAAVIDMPQAGQAAVVVAAPLPPAGSDRATAVVINAVLGGGFSSRLNQEIRIKRGLSYGAGSGLDLRPAGGSLRASVQTKNESAAEVVGLVQGEFDRLMSAPVDEAELSARKETLIGEVSRSIETTAGLNASVAALIVDGRPLSDLRTRIQALSAVSSADVQSYAKANFGAARRRLVVAGQAAQFAQALREGAPSLIVIPARQLDLDTGAGLTIP